MTCVAIKVEAWSMTTTTPTAAAAGTCLWLAGLLSGCDHGLDAGSQEGTGLAGRITFIGEWPSEVAEVAVAVYENHPQSLADFLGLSGWDSGVEIGSPTYDYYVSLENEGVYRWVIVAWHSPEGIWDFTSLLGCYHVGSDSLPSPVPVILGQVADGIDITVDFAILRGGAVPVLRRGSASEDGTEGGTPRTARTSRTGN